MWYECIPSMAIITVCMSLPNVFAWGVHKLVQGNVSQITSMKWPTEYTLTCLYNTMFCSMVNGMIPSGRS